MPDKRCFGIVAGAVVLTVCLAIALIVDSVHVIDEGEVGVYFVYGELEYTLGYPGVNWAQPFVTKVERITSRPITNTLEDIDTVTVDGIEITYHDVEVISDVEENQILPLVEKYGPQFRTVMVFDRIREEMRLYSANHTIDEVYNSKFLNMVQKVKTRVEANIKRLGMNGIKVLNLVIPKPSIPEDIALNYQKVKVQWTEQLVATQKQKTELIKKETESQKAQADANRLKAVLEIDVQKNLLDKESQKKLAQIENEILKAREQNKADVENYKKTKESEANAKLFTKEYVQLEMAKAMTTNTKMFFSGDNSPLGAIFAKVFGQGQ